MKLLVNNISKKLGKRLIIENFSLNEIGPAMIIIKGANGSGKTTLLKIISGLITPDTGSIDTHTNNNNKRELNISYCDNNFRGFFLRISGIENLEYFGSLNNLSKSEVKNNVFKLFSFFEPDSFIHLPINKMSLGQVQMVSIMRAMQNKPDLLLFDEVGTNIDKEKLQKFSLFLNGYLKYSKALFIHATHNHEFDLGIKKSYLEL